MGFEVGREKTGGRKAGVPNRATAQFKTFWQTFLESAEYRENLKQRVLSGSAPHMEKYLAELLHGRPRQEADGSEGIQVVILPAQAQPKPVMLEHATGNGEERE